MKIKRFFAKDMRTALAEVKETLGPDAVIMSNKKVTGGVEIVAAVDYQSQVPGPKDAPVRRQLNEESVNISSAGKQMTRSAPPKEQNEYYADTLAALLARQQKLNPANRRVAMAPRDHGLAAERATVSQPRPPGPPMALPAPSPPDWRARPVLPEPWPNRASGAPLPSPPSPRPVLPPPRARPSPPSGIRRWRGCARRWPASASCWSTRSPA